MVLPPAQSGQTRIFRVSGSTGGHCRRRFLILAALSYMLDKAEPSWLEPLREVMSGHVFGDPESTGSLLGTIAAGVITVSSITFSILLLAMQQSAAAMTHAVLDQFLRRRFNQAFFGAYIGVAVYSLVTLATVNPPFNPVFGASLSLVSAVVTLTLLPLLIYKTIDQNGRSRVSDAHRPGHNQHCRYWRTGPC